MAEGGERRRLFRLPFRARIELEPPAGVVGDPVRSLEEIFMDKVARMNFLPIRRTLGKIHSKLFNRNKTPMPLICLYKMLKNLKKLSLRKRSLTGTHDIKTVKHLKYVIPVVGLDNLDVFSSKFLELFSFDESNLTDKRIFFVSVVDYMVALFEKGAGEIMQAGAAGGVQPGAADLDEGDEDEDDEDDDEEEDEDPVGEGAAGDSEIGAADYSYSAEEENANTGDEDYEIQREVEVDHELVKTIEAIVYTTEIEILNRDIIAWTKEYCSANKRHFCPSFTEALDAGGVKLSLAVQEYTGPLINKYSIQVFCLAMKSAKLKHMKKKFPVALYNQLKDRINQKPLTKEMAGENWQLCVVWMKMWLKMRDPQTTRKLPGLDDKEKCVSCLEDHVYRGMVVLDSCDHSFCQPCTEKLISAEVEVLNKVYIARCPLCKGYFRSWTTRTNYIQIRNRLKLMNAFNAIIPAHVINGCNSGLPVEN